MKDEMPEKIWVDEPHLVYGQEYHGNKTWRREKLLGDETAYIRSDLVAEVTAERDRLREALKQLSFAAQITGGVAGRDENLCAAIDNAQKALEGREGG